VSNRQTEPDFVAQLSDIPDPGASAPSIPAMPALPASPARRVARNQRIAALAGGGAWLALHLAVYGVRGDLSALPLPYVAAQIALPFAVAAGSLFVALKRGALGLGVKLALVSALAVLGPASFCILGAGAPPPRALEPESSSLIGALLCFDLTTVWAALPLLGAAIALRGAFAVGAPWRSALVGAAIGLFAGASMNLHCPNVAPLHMLFGHGLAVIVAALLGAFVLAYRTRA
jgi:hypothetical protein